MSGDDLDLLAGLLSHLVQVAGAFGANQFFFGERIDDLLVRDAAEVDGTRTTGLAAPV